MAIIRLQVSFEAETEIPADVITNTWHMEDNAGLSNPTNMFNLIRDFYLEDWGSGSVTDLFSAQAFSGNAGIKLYNLDDPEPRAPIMSDGFTFTPSAVETLPHEVALCLSYQAAPESGTAQARRRGRIYVGPLRIDMTDTGRPTQGAIDVLCAGAANLLAASNSSVNERWVVYSPTGDSFAQVEGGWVDNAWDTQRRRGVGPTDRTTWESA